MDPHKTDRDFKGRTLAQANKLLQMDAEDTVVGFHMDDLDEDFGDNTEEDGL